MGGVAILPGVVPPQINDPTQVMSRVATLGNIVQERQLHQQQVQENTIKLQEMQQNQKDQQAFNALYVQNNGDMDKTIEGAAKAGVSPMYVSKAAEAHQTLRTKAAQLDEATLKNTQERGNQFAGYLLPIKSIQDPDQKAAAYADAYRDAVSKKLIDPNDQSIPSTYPGDAGLDSAIAHAMGAKEYSTYGLNTLREAREKADADQKAKMAGPQLTEATAKANEQTTKAASQELSAAKSQTDWDNTIKKYPGSEKTFGTMYSPEAVSRASELGITPEQRTRNAEIKQAHDDLTDYRNRDKGPKTHEDYIADAADPTSATRQQSQVVLDKEVEQHLKELKPGSATGSLRTYITNEGKLNRMRSTLGTAISSGKVYVDRNGGMKPIASLGDEDAQAAGVEEMKNRFHDVTDELKGVIEEKNNTIIKSGGQPTVTTQQAHAALDAGTSKLFTPKGTAPAPAKPAAAAPVQAGPPVALLKEGKATKFKNGQVWTLENGKQKQLN